MTYVTIYRPPNILEGSGVVKEMSKGFPISRILILSLAIFSIILSELGIPGILPQLAAEFDISLARAGNLVGYYALSTAIASIPITKLLMSVNRKKVMLSIFAVYTLVNLSLAFINSYSLALLFRVILGTTIGAFWPIITYYAMSLADMQYRGRAVTVANAGSPIAILVGVPTLTALAQQFSWRIEFLIMAGLGVILLLLIYFFLPSAEGEESEDNKISYKAILTDPPFLRWLLITVFVIGAQYATYVYITEIVQNIDYGQGVAFAQLLFGIGTIISIIVTAAVIDNHYFKMITAYFLLGAGAIAVFFFLPDASLWHSVAFIVWGISFGSMSPIFQTAVTRLFPHAASAANSIQSSLFNFSIMLGSSVGGWIISQYSLPLLLMVGSGALFLIVIYIIIQGRAGRLTHAPAGK